ncbi:MAG: serine/threonine protein kinase [Verrucomicrobiaceae bacterium]|nr:serine/threonine protein kinase [Verrucomicrobiaceae bacterium]
MAEDPYIPEEQVGVGPSAKVYRAHEVRENRLVRLKVLLAEHESPYALDRDHLADRISQLKQVRHPRVCRLIALDVQAQDVSLVSEFAEGLNGWAFSQQSQLTSETLRTLATQLMEALQAGEASHTSHGDVKPCNVFIENRPLDGMMLRLQDWGVGQSRHRQPRETLCFRAPEHDDNLPPTVRGDLFSAGATLAAICTGHSLVDGKTKEELQTAWQEFSNAEWQAMCPHIDKTLLRWLSWLLQIQPDKRPISASVALAGLSGRMKMTSAEHRPWWMTILLIVYNLSVIGTLAAFLLWLSKALSPEGLAQLWHTCLERVSHLMH